GDRRGPEAEAGAGSLRSLPYFDEPWTEWGQFVAANSVLDTAFTVMIEACVEGSVEVLRHRLRKMLMEERYHFLHGRSWLRSGIDVEPLHRAWREAVEWFGPPDGETAQFYKDGRLSMGPAELHARLEERLETRGPETTIEWKHWDPVRRRERPGAIDDRTFAMLRGLEAKRFAQAKEAGHSAPRPSPRGREGCLSSLHPLRRARRRGDLTVRNPGHDASVPVPTLRHPFRSHQVRLGVVVLFGLAGRPPAPDDRQRNACDEDGDDEHCNRDRQDLAARAAMRNGARRIAGRGGADVVDLGVDGKRLGLR